MAIKLAVDASRSVDKLQKTGVEVVSDALLKHLEATCPKNVEITYYTPEYISWLPRDKQRLVKGRRFWTVWHLSWALFRDRPDALFVPVHNLPQWLPKINVRVIHDVSSFRTPEAYNFKERCLIRMDAWRSKWFCQKVIVPTEAVKQDLVNFIGFDRARIIMTGWALDEAEIPPVLAPEPMAPRSKPYVLFVGRLEEKKNVQFLIEAFQQFKKAHPDYELLLIGKPGHGFEAIEPLLKLPGVVRLGYVSTQEKWQLLRAAQALVIPSKEEGFSFPMLEAFQVGVPVIASDIPPLLELGRDACLFASLTDKEDFVKQLTSIADQQVDIEMMTERGRKRLRDFNWTTIAYKVWEALALPSQTN